MTNLQTPTATSITVTRILPQPGPAFGMTPDGDSVFIPTKIVGIVNPQPGNRYKAKVILSDTPQKTTFVAVRVEAEARPIPEDIDGPVTDRGVAAEVIARKALALVLDDGGVWSVSSLMDEIVGDWNVEDNRPELNAISNKLHAAHGRGEIACASIYSNPNQRRASQLLWATRWSDFEEEACYAEG